MKYSLLLLVYICFINPFKVISQEIGNPIVSNYSSKDYKGHTQNWVIAIDSNGIVYSGNQAGVLVFDGLEWRTVALNNHSTVRSLSLNKGKVYVGAIGEIGYLDYMDNGKLYYQSLNAKLDSAYVNFADVWNCQAHDGKVYFLTDNYIFVWDGESFSYLKTKGDFFYACYSVDTVFMVQDFGYGLCQLSGDSLALLDGGSLLALAAIHGIVPFTDTTLFLGIRSYRPLEFDLKNGHILNFKNDINVYLKEKLLYHAIPLDNNLIALATIKNGIVIMNHQGEVVEVINKKSGLQDETVYYLKKEGSVIWAALEKGISKIEYPSALRFWGETSGLSGSITDILRFNKHIYASTGSGVYRLAESRDGERSDFILNDSLTEQAWDMQVFIPADSSKQFLLAAMGKGLYTVHNQDAALLYRGESVFKILPSKKIANRIYLGMKSFLTYIDYNTHTASFSDIQIIETFNTEIRELEEDDDGTLWAGLVYTGAAKITVNEALDSISYKTHIYAQEAGLSLDRELRIFQYQHNWYFATEKGVYFYDVTADSMFMARDFMATFGIIPGRPVLVNTRGDHTIWVNGQCFVKNASGIYKAETADADRLQNFTLENQFIDDDQSVWLGTSEGICRIKSQPPAAENPSFKTLIRKVMSKNDSVLHWGNIIPKKPLEIKHKNNLLSFHFVATYARNSEKTLYSYRLVGYEDAWSEWSETNKKDYTNLFEGSYTFQVKAKNYRGHEGTIDSYQFVILPPIYRTFWAYLLYVLLLVVVLNFIVNIRTRKLRADKIKLERIIVHRTQEIRFQKEETEKAALRLAEANLELKKLSIIAQKTDNAVAVFDKHGDIEWVNDGFIQMHGYSIEEFSRERGKNILKSSGNPYIKDAIQQCMDTKETTIYQFFTTTKNQKEIWVQTTLTPIIGKSGELARLISIDSDITKIKEAEQKIQVQRDELQSANETKDKFFSIIAHDLRGPLSSIFTLLNILHIDFEEFDQQEIRSFVEQLRETTANTFNLTENLLEWAHLRRDGINYHPSEISLNDIVNENMELYSSQALKKGIQLINNLADSFSAFADMEMIKTVIRNLIGNAIKFTDEKGSIAISSSLENDQIWVTVSDTGKGMDQWEIDQLFKLDSHHTTLGTQREKGSGLGLILVKEFVTKNQGVIRVESSKGKGSAFSFSLPLHKPS